MRRAPLVLTAALVAAFVPARSPAASFVRGDIDAGGAIDLSDPVGIIHSLFLGAGTLPCLDAADADDTGVLDLSDPIHLLSHLFLSGSPPPAPFPACGADPTADALDCARWERPECGPPPPPDFCNNVVARAAERGCGRVFVWGDEHVNSDGYWPAQEPFWRNVLTWLAETTCDGAPRTRVGFSGAHPWPSMVAMMSSMGLTSFQWNSGLQDVDILVIQPGFVRGQAQQIADWVQNGGALMAFTGGWGGRHQNYCMEANETIEPLGIVFDCFHEAPWGPVTAFEGHPIAEGLVPDNAPFVNGANILDVEGSTSEVVARIGTDCQPKEVEDCRFPIEFTGPAAGETLSVDSTCVNEVHGGVNLPSPGLELNVLTVYEPESGPGGEIHVRVERTEPMVLALCSNDEALWVLDLAPGAAVEELILSGGSGTQSAIIPIDFQGAVRIFDSISGSLGHGYGHDCGGGSTDRMVNGLQQATGQVLRSLHGCYRSSSFVLR